MRRTKSNSSRRKLTSKDAPRTIRIVLPCFWVPLLRVSTALSCSWLVIRLVLIRSMVLWISSIKSVEALPRSMAYSMMMLSMAFMLFWIERISAMAVPFRRLPVRSSISLA